MDDGRDGVEEGQRILAGERAERGSERGRGEGAGGDDDAFPLRRRQPGDFLAPELDQRLRPQRCLDRGGEAVPVDRERAAGGHAMRVGGAQHQRGAAPHLRVQQSDGVVLGIVGAEGVGADQLGERRRDMRLGAAHRPHLVQHHADAGARQLPGGLAAGKAAADDVDGGRAAHGVRARL